MVCEKCQKKEAIIHFTLMQGTVGETVHHNLCEACYQVAESEREKNGNSVPNTPLPDNVENITAIEYLSMNEKAQRNSADHPAFAQLNDELKKLPQTCQRLSFEMFDLAWQALEQGHDPHNEVMFATIFGDSFGQKQIVDYDALLEKIVIRCFQLHGSPKASWTDAALAMTLIFSLVPLRKRDRARFDEVIKTLKNLCLANETEDRRSKVLSDFEKRLKKHQQS